jgi:hypothetical protein
MECDIDTLRAFLVAAGCPDEAVAGLARDAPLGDQGISPQSRAALAGLLTEGLGVPGAPGTLLETGSLDDWHRFVARHLDDETVRKAAVARIRAGAGELPPGQDYGIGRMRPEDAFGVARLFYAIYDANYPVVDYYVPEKVSALNRRNDVLTVVGRLSTGEIAGQGAYFRSSSPNPAVYEMGQVHVVPAYRASSLPLRLFACLDEMSGTMDWVEAFFGEAVCTHLVTQKLVTRHGYADCGLELSLMPNDAYEKEGYSLRVSCLLSFRVVRDRPLPLFLPECYRPVLEHVLSGFSLDRDIRFAASDLPSDQTTGLTSRIFGQAQVERVQVATIGRDFADHVAALEERAVRQGLAVVEVYLRTAAAGVAFAVSALRKRGFVFGAFAPLWFDGGDAVMLQRLATPPDFDAINLLTDRAKTILVHIRDEWEARGLG